MTTIDQYLESKRDAHLAELKELLRIPSVSTKPDHADAVKECAGYVKDRLEEIGLEAKIYETDLHPIVYAEWLGAPDAPTVLIYGHYDVQPPEPIELWRNPPFEPTCENGNIVARGATDDKGQMYTHIKAVEAHMKTNGKLPVNVKFIIEGEEEVGSPSLDPFLEANKELLAADSVLVSDTPMYGPGRPSITYGLRGIIYIEVSVTGPSHDLHSGLYGGAVRNPINALSAMIGKLIDEDGRITVPGFYDDVVDLTDEERAEYEALAYDEEAFKKEVGVDVAPGEPGWSVLERLSARPTLDCNGIWGGYTAEGAKTVLPSQAHAKISCRLVPNQKPEDIEHKLRSYLQELAPTGVSVDVKSFHGTIPFVVDRSAPTMQAAIRALERVWGVQPVFTRGGGSIPVVASFKNILGLDTVLMGFGLEDDRLHSPNEKFALANYFGGIRASAYMLEELAKG